MEKIIIKVNPIKETIKIKKSNLSDIDVAMFCIEAKAFAEQKPQYIKITNGEKFRRFLICVARNIFKFCRRVHFIATTIRYGFRAADTNELKLLSKEVKTRGINRYQ